MRLVSCSRCGKIHAYGQCKRPKFCTTSERKKETQQYRGNYWRKIRKQVLERDRYLCRWCLAKHGRITTTNLEVHHIVPIYDNPELVYEYSNLITVCRTCHEEVEGKYQSELTDIALKSI